jgi:hypothetical protein
MATFALAAGADVLTGTLAVDPFVLTSAVHSSDGDSINGGPGVLEARDRD